jgi:hypothetical protein
MEQATISIQVIPIKRHPQNFSLWIFGITTRTGAQEWARKHGASVVYFDERKQRAYLVNGARAGR